MADITEKTRIKLTLPALIGILFGLLTLAGAGYAYQDRVATEVDLKISKALNGYLTRVEFQGWQLDQNQKQFAESQKRDQQFWTLYAEVKSLEKLRR